MDSLGQLKAIEDSWEKLTKERNNLRFERERLRKENERLERLLATALATIDDLKRENAHA